jgi:hypothetical protein
MLSVTKESVLHKLASFKDRRIQAIITQAVLMAALDNQINDIFKELRMPD